MQYANHEPPYHGEPLNIIITALSDPYILTDEGLQTYSKLVLSDLTVGIRIDPLDRQVYRFFGRVFGHSPRWQARRGSWRWG